MKDKILHVSWSMNIGGAERALFQLIREQHRHGIDASLLVESTGGLYAQKTHEAGAEVYELQMKNALDVAVTKRFKQLLQNHSLIHFHNASPWLIKVASAEPGIKKYYTHRGGVRQYDIKKKLRYTSVGYFLKKYFNGVSGNTRQACIAASKLYGIAVGNIPVTYNGLDFSLLTPNRNKNEVLAELGNDNTSMIRIGTSANLRDWKRIDLLIRAIYKLRDHSFHCYIIGDGPIALYLKEMVKELGIKHMVTFTGKKSHIGDYLQILDIFVLPSGPQESFGNSAVEAMGVGLPTIIFKDGGGLLEHIENGKTGFIVNDLKDLTDHLDLLAKDANSRLTIGNAAKITVREKYSLTKMVENYASFYTGNHMEILHG